MSDWILDASAILVILNHESGSEKAEAMLPGAFVSSVNVAEVAGKLADLGMPASDIQAAIEALGLTIVEFDLPMALEAGILRTITRKAGLSLGDRACLAAARVLNKSVLTADRTWADIKIGAKIRLVR